MDIGRALISTIVDYNDISMAAKEGVRAEWFEDLDQRSVYVWMLDYYDRYAEVPTEIALKAQFPNFKLLSVAEPYEFYIDRFRQQHERSILVDAVIAANAALDDDDTKGAHAHLTRGVARVGLEVNVLVDDNAVGRESRQERYKRYEEIRTHAGVLTGVATGFDGLDFVTNGYHNGQFILIGGAPKQMKSYALMLAAIAAHNQGKRVLFASFEMSAKEQLLRYDSICSHINSWKLRHGLLDDAEMKRMKKVINARQNLEPFVISSDISAMTTTSALSAKVEEHDPDVVYIDGVYLMENEIGAEPLSTQAYTAISRATKRMAQRIDRPVICTTQALSSKLGKGGEVMMASMGWTSAWAQDADVILGSMALPAEHMLKLNIVGGRDVSPCEMSIACNWEESTFTEITTDEEDDDE